MNQMSRSANHLGSRRFRRLLVALWMGLVTIPVYGQGDSYLHLGESGYALLPDSQVHDLDYTTGFSVEAMIKIEPGKGGGRWPYIVAKAVEGPGYYTAAPGFALGLEQGHLQTYGQSIVAKVSDGTNQIILGASQREGYAYAVMTWDATSRILSLYVNGEIEESEANSSIVPSRIKNDEPLGVGYATIYDPLGRDVMLARLWNRKLESTEVEQLWSNFAATGRHAVPEGFDRQRLHSEWLMYETSNTKGGTGTTHVKDTAGANHLRLYDGATVERGTGSLTSIYPADGQSGVDKSVALVATGGRNALSGEITLPLQYFFQVDESPDFDTPALKESSWLTHYGQWRPILKPRTFYHWRVKVRDSSVPAKESAFTPIRTFSTEGPSNWYVRPRNENVTYGTEDGTSYGNAFNGLVNWDNDRGALPGIVWGPDGVEAGDNLYICDRHTLDPTEGGFSERGIIYIKANGYSPEYPVTIRGDYPGHHGIVVGLEPGYSLQIDRKKYIRFLGIAFEGFNLATEPTFKDGTDEVVTDTPRSTHIVFDGCTMAYAEALVVLDSGHDHWTFRNNTMTNAGSAILTRHSGDTAADFLTVSNNVFEQLGLPPYEHPDAHAVGIGAGEGHIIEGNYIENTGTAIEFWTSTYPMKNMIIRHNFIKDMKKKRITEGHGIAISGENNTSLGLRTGFRVYGNIIVNTEGSGISSNNKDPIEVYNNVICNCEHGLRFAVINAPFTGRVYNNIIIEPRDSVFYVVADPNVPWSEVSWDHNIYWPTMGDMTGFSTILTPRFTFLAHQNTLGWDAHSLLVDPCFVSSSHESPEDFRLQSISPAIDAGRDVGIAYDFDGNEIPWGAGPDIGAYEYTGETWP